MNRKSKKTDQERIKPIVCNPEMDASPKSEVQGIEGTA